METTPHEVEVTSLNHPSPSCVDMSKKKKKINVMRSNMQGQSKKLLWPEASSQKKKLVGTNKLNFYFLPYTFYFFRFFFSQPYHFFNFF